MSMEPGQWPQWRPLKRHDSHVAEQMVERAAELARDSHARTRHAAVLVKDGSLLAWVPGLGPAVGPVGGDSVAGSANPMICHNDEAGLPAIAGSPAAVCRRRDRW